MPIDIFDFFKYIIDKAIRLEGKCVNFYIEELMIESRKFDNEDDAKIAYEALKDDYIDDNLKYLLELYALVIMSKKNKPTS